MLSRNFVVCAPGSIIDTWMLYGCNSTLNHTTTGQQQCHHFPEPSLPLFIPRQTAAQGWGRRRSPRILRGSPAGMEADVAGLLWDGKKCCRVLQGWKWNWYGTQKQALILPNLNRSG